MTILKKSIVLIVGLLLMTKTMVGNEQPKVDIGINEHLGSEIPLDVKFFNEQGYIVPLNEILKKPTILNFVYFRCPGICSPLLTEIASIVNQLDLELGKDYQIVTVSFNAMEGPELAAAKKASYVGLLNKRYPETAWSFLTGDSANIYALTNAAGFMFQKQGVDFVHPGVIIAVSAEGKITRYLQGTKFLPFDVKMAITEASEGRTGPTIARILQMCYSYNPDGRTYVFNVTRVAGAGILLCAVLFVAFLTIKSKKEKS